MMPQIITTATLIACVVLAFTTFCRLAKMSKEKSKTSARFVFWSLCSVSWFAVFSIFFYGWKPDFIHLLAFSLLAYLQILSRKGWRGGVPAVFQHTKIGGQCDN